MKKLEDFVKEELDRFLPAMIGDKVVITPETIKETMEAAKRTHERLHQDPALAMLVKAMVITSTAASRLPVPQEVRDQVVMQLFVRLVTIWEDANNAFNRQFQPPPQLPKS